MDIVGCSLGFGVLLVNRNGFIGVIIIEMMVW